MKEKSNEKGYSKQVFCCKVQIYYDMIFYFLKKEANYICYGHQ